MNTSDLRDRPGCLVALFRLFRGPAPTKEPQILSAYSKEKSLLSSDELAYYEALKVVVGTRLMIMSKVRQWDIFAVKHSSYSIQTTASNKVQSKHVDFLLCDPNTFAPVLIIELDGSSHQSQDRKERDRFLDAVCQHVDLPIIHAESAKRYDPNDIYQDIVSALKPTE